MRKHSNIYYYPGLINDEYLRDYSPKEMIYLAAIFAGIIEQVQDSGIWQAEWAKGQQTFLEEMRQIGHAIYVLIKPDITTTQFQQK
jgi:hypothetical protein